MAGLRLTQRIFRPSSGSSFLQLLRARGHRIAMLVMLDMGVVCLAYSIALPTRFAGIPPERYREALWDLMPFILVIYLVSNCVFRLYQRWWRYAGSMDLVAAAASGTAATLAILVRVVLLPDQNLLPTSAVLLGGFLSTVGFAVVRYHARVLHAVLREIQLSRRAAGDSEAPKHAKVLIVGAGDVGGILAGHFLGADGCQFVGFIDDDPYKLGVRVRGRPVLGDRHAIPQVVSQHDIDLIIIATYNITGEDFRAIVDECEKTRARVKVLPKFLEFLHTDSPKDLIRDLRPEDLLGRQLVLEDQRVSQSLVFGKTVLVTGAAGSIGSELCVQLARLSPRCLIALDNNESGLHDLMTTNFTPRPASSESDNGGALKAVGVIGDVTDQLKMRSVFDRYCPEVIFHAAAYKHVPLMEENPDEAVHVNVEGTRIVVDLAMDYRAGHFVLVSTDKAINPSCVMGATKRLCEMLVMNAGERHRRNNGRPQTRCTAVRFGNVIGSRGSVVPTFERQIAMGGPVTVSHPDMTRYFMSISEAVRLIIEAAARTQGDDIFMLEMGQQLNIDDLARRLIRMRGLCPDVDIPIVYTGTRPGEKMYEELLGPDEIREPTSHSHVYRIRSHQSAQELSASLERIDALIELAHQHRNAEILAMLNTIIASVKPVDGLTENREIHRGPRSQFHREWT